MLTKFFRHRKYNKLIKVSSSFILKEFAYTINEVVEHFEKEGQIKNSEQKECLKFETTALAFWLFQKTDIFPELWHKLLLDEIHNQYYKRLRKHGYDFKMRQLVSNDFNLRYKAYSESYDEDQDLSKVGAKFVRFLSERSKTDIDIKDIMIPLYIAKKITPKFKEWREVIKN